MTERKEHILHCAQRLFDRYGYENVTIREIASESHSSIGSIYHYFRDKSELLTWWFDQTDTRYQEARRIITETPRSGERPSLGRLKEFFVQVQVICTEFGEQALRVSYLNGLKYPDINSMRINRERILYKIFIEMVGKCREEGSISSTLSDDEIFEQFVIISRGLLVDWLVRRGEFEMVVKSAVAFDIMLRGLS
ncbi:MAG: TetR/AcrR family transcriptional regulator [Synergistaceae bacterium]|jgi:AcrR family transcriptional regulator|nr:TetR/AcrR family transcriptional regulator [Synergistaceae bacterium]